SISQILNSLEDPILKKYSSKWIKDILTGVFTPVWIKEIISSQFDADRLDYLLRDAYMCGVKYAGFDWQWLFHNMFIGEIKSQHRHAILFDGNKGIHSLESFVVSRYHMYEQVYFHKTTRGFEAIVNSIFKRLNYLIQEKRIDDGYFLGNNFSNFLQDYESIDDYLRLDDYYMTTHFNHWTSYSKDGILKELCLAFINRQPFKLLKTMKSENFDVRELNEIQDVYKNKLGAEQYEYYFLVDDYKNNPYKDSYLLGKKSAEASELIWLKKGKEIQELSNLSMIINALRNNEFKVTRFFVNRNYV
ncbi:MAG: hypothetical protein ACJ748_15180, partial [Flavisolibacter sp.]